VDDTYFDDNNLPYAYDQQPHEDNKFRAPVGAVSLNFNALSILVRPGPTAMVKARVLFDPPGYAAVINDTVTVGLGTHNPKISAVKFENRTKVRVWGQIPLGSKPARYYRRIDNPSLFSGYGLKGVLKEAGIAVGGDVRTGQVPPGLPLIASHSSLPLSSILWNTGKMSNNFVTETILKTIGAETAESPATWDAATSAVEKVLEGWGIKPGSYQYKNGSGLFNANKVSASQFCRVLVGAYSDIGIRPEFLAQLATGGVDGTIGARYRSDVTKRHVRAKTGTLSSVSALTGYVFDKKGEHPIAFSILVNKAAGYVFAARNYQEKLVTAIAKFLNPQVVK
jgi:D-alanyl-D-alanine carboxypeptidase/D-alanyl-D-alanine-endopeptidase (penicillin-binding protein 4)